MLDARQSKMGALDDEEEGGASSGRRPQRSARPKRGACLESGMFHAVKSRALYQLHFWLLITMEEAR